MPHFIHLSDEDIYSIIAFLRSDDPWVQAQDVDDYDSKPSLLSKILLRTVFKPNEYPKEKKVAPDISDKVAYGKYLSDGMLDCYSCHSASFTTMDVVNTEKSEGYYGGGNETKDFSGRTIYTPNITMDEEHGIGKWTEQDFIRAVKYGFRPDNTYMRAPMSRLIELTDEEASAIWAYLQTVPKLKTARKKSEEINLAANATEGQKLYYKYGCQSCHGDAGTGQCDLRQAHQKYSSNADLKKWIEDPSQFVKDSKMPTWKDLIKEEEYGPLMEYVRQLGEKSMKEGKPMGMLEKK
jgi:mono/diheme cytochrome c family protein